MDVGGRPKGYERKLQELFDEVGCRTDWSRFAVGLVDLPTATDDAEAQWQPYQIEYLDSVAERKCSLHDTKARQIGWSWTVALAGILAAFFEPRGLAVYVSFNQDEACEKIRYARQILDSLRAYPGGEYGPEVPRSSRSPLYETMQGLELHNGSRLRSHPARLVRGKANPHIFLDEFAYVKDAAGIYKAALPALAKAGRGSLTMGSTCLGESGQFWEIGEEERKAYPGFNRRKLPWWLCDWLRAKDAPPAAEIEQMPTAERVERAGSQTIKDQYANMDEDDFCQEQECLYRDESTAYYTWESIMACTDSKERWPYKRAEGMDAGMAAIRWLADHQKPPKGRDDLPPTIGPTCYAGFDVGRVKDKSELEVIERRDDRKICRLGISLSGVPLPQQEALLQAFTQDCYITKGFVDESGLGRHLADALSETGKWEGMSFTQANKESMAVEMRVAMDGRELVLPADRDLHGQIHSIKQTASATGHRTFDAARTAKGHADRFWALALANWAGAQRVGQPFRPELW